MKSTEIGTCILAQRHRHQQLNCYYNNVRRAAAHGRLSFDDACPPGHAGLQARRHGGASSTPNDDSAMTGSAAHAAQPTFMSQCHVVCGGGGNAINAAL